MSGAAPFKRQPSKSGLETTIGMIPQPQQAPVTIYPGPARTLANLSKADLEIAQRLDNLRRSGSEALPTDEEMASRLAQLKGLPSDHYTRQPPPALPRQDPRSESQKAQDLLAQVMEEVSLDSRMASADDELEARLARLRGVDPRAAGSGAVGAAALPPAAYGGHPGPRVDPLLDDDMADMDLDEVESLMQAAAKEESAAASRAMADLQGDAAVAQAVARATKRKDKKSRKKSRGAGGGAADTSDEERRSKEYDSDLSIEGGKAIDAVKDQQEVQRIIDMYTRRAQLKKERKRKKKEAGGAVGGAGAAAGDDSDSDIDTGSDSSLTSDSEKFSDSDNLSD